MNHKTYWEQRMKDLEKEENKIVKKLQKAYERANKELELALSDLFIEMIEDGGVSPANLYKYDRYTTLQDKIRQLANHLGKVEQQIINDYLIALYKEEFQQYAEFMGDLAFYNVSEQEVKAAVATNWSGEQFSERVWNNKSLLVEHLDKVIIAGIALGVSRQKMSKMVKERIQIAHHCADRLVRTESMYIYNRAHYDNYKKAGIIEYEFLAEIDSRTSKKCRQHNGNAYFLADAQVGDNYPPLHPNCRSTVIPIIKR